MDAKPTLTDAKRTLIERSVAKIKGLWTVVSKRWFEFCGGTKFRYPLFTSILPHFNLFLT